MFKIENNEIKRKNIEEKLIKNFLRTKDLEIIKTNFNTLNGKIDYIVKEKKLIEANEGNIINFAKIKELKYKTRFIIVQKLNILNYKREFNKKSVSKNYIKNRNIIQNIFTYLTINKIKEESAVDLIQIFIGDKVKKIKYRKNIINIKNISNYTLLRDVI